MSARALDISTFVLPPESSSNPTLQPIQANSTVGFELDSYTAVQTLSANLFNISPDQVQGLLYVPSLDVTDDCFNQSAPFVPKNATRRANIPSTTYTAIALAPWFSVDCTKAYLRAATQDVDFIRGIIFFQGNGTSSNEPPPVSDPIWTLNDGGSWKSQLQFPAYAIPGPIGRLLMTQLSLYSGNVSTAPHGQALAQDFGNGGMPRLYASMVIDNGPSLPSLWVFLIIVLGILLAIVTGSSLFMGFVQRRRRQALRRRVLNGEVDLEALGIKRMTVPQSQLDKMPMYTFKGEQAAPTENSTTPKDGDAINAAQPKPNTSGISPDTPLPAPTALPDQNGQFYSQTTCSICLDDFVSNETQVRELPCHHIFHAECVDPFLLEHSSSCPVCKKSTLPDGFCPENITNAMVRREQLIRRIQERRGTRGARRIPGSTASRSPQRQTPQQPPIAAVMRRVAALRTTINTRLHRQPEAQNGTLPTSSPTATPPRQGSVEMTPIPATSTEASATPGNRASVLALQSESDPARRREMARQRAVANLDRQDAAVEQQIETEVQRLPLWRRGVGRIFPGLTG